ncbi:VOC family protein [Pseudonocardia oroxyli]|uniref:Catechol 2,3-dioxygenase n=1 Tax=Pseudonocardia oroxyli TaxID=366584 RepID=A0A1G7NRG3_PSEOR|nr:VOC family protein [Pseudonocardia oroxyli]SDF75840.1 Catechol 2,3-dioxygenase [Pseudonocardia oroxyli]
MPELVRLRGVKLPVTDVSRSVDFYRRVFGFAPWLEFPDDAGVLRGVAGDLPGCEGGLALRETPEAHSQPGLELLLGVADKRAIEEWTVHLDALGVAHSPVIDATVGWLLVLHDPDGHEIHLYSEVRHGIDQSGRSGYGRLVDS